MKRVIIILLALLLTGCSSGEISADSAEILMINVGKGDAILAFSNDKTYLIDTGKPEAFGRVCAALEDNGVQKLDGVFITHADDDHVGGLSLLVDAGYKIDRIFASGYCIKYKEEKHPAVVQAKRLGKEVEWLYAGDSVDELFYVYAPDRLFEDKEDNNSLVMMMKTKSGRILLTGDMEYPQEAALMSSGADLACEVLKVPNHADDDTLSSLLIGAARASVALISTSSYEKPETPDPKLVERLEAAGVEVYYTEFSNMGIRVSMTEAGISVSYETWKNAPDIPSGVTISDVLPDDDLIVIECEKDTDVSLWQIFSDKGEEVFVFKKGQVLKKGQTVIGTNTSKEGSYDILWDDNNVIHNKKMDNITLLDGYGRQVAWKWNGR